jgi:hypothetical protein
MMRESGKHKIQINARGNEKEKSYFVYTNWADGPEAVFIF